MVGSRSLPTSLHAEMKEKLNQILSNYTGFVIISGGARGADTLARVYAFERDIPFEEYPAKWDVYGKSAGYRRNAEMVKEASMLIAMWDGDREVAFN